MIDDGAVECLGSACEAAGRALVAFAWSRIAARVIVGEDDPGAVVKGGVGDDRAKREVGAGFVAGMPAEVDAAGVIVEASEALVGGEAMRPLSPAHLRAAIAPYGSLRCTWVRRSRRGWACLDSVDAPLDCSSERYRIAVSSGVSRIALETTLPEAEFHASDLVTFQGGPAEVSVVQVGDVAVSHAATLIIHLG